MLPGGAFYHATKFSVEALSDALRFEVRNFGIDVIVIEPGAIMTQFGDTAAARVEALGSEGSAYGEFRRKLADEIRKSYAGKPDAMGGVADDVALVIQKSITVRGSVGNFVCRAFILRSKEDSHGPPQSPLYPGRCP